MIQFSQIIIYIFLFFFFNKNRMDLQLSCRRVTSEKKTCTHNIHTRLARTTTPEKSSSDRSRSRDAWRDHALRNREEIDQASSRDQEAIAACVGRALLHITSFSVLCVVMRDPRVSNYDDRVLCIPRIHRLAWCASSLQELGSLARTYVREKHTETCNIYTHTN